MVLCRFWAQGRCKNGDRCSFEHPRDLAPRNDNRFAALQSPENSSSSKYGRPPIDNQPKYNLNRDAIITDLSTELPQWVLSAYTASPKAPVQLFGGPQREQSFEEMRLNHYKALTTGNPAPAIQEANALVQGAEAQIQNALSNIDAAIDFVKRGDNEHPNRIDICEFSVNNPGQPFPVVGSTVATAPANPSPFGGSGSTTFQQSTSAFGQPSTMGSTVNPFGAASQKNPPFGQPAPLGAFGQPSTLGQKSNPFAATTAPGSTAQVGSSAAMGFSSFTAQSNPFGPPSQSASSNGFGQPSQAQPNPFGHITPASGAAPFGQSHTPVNPFGGSSQAQANPFGGPSTGPKNVFGAVAEPASINPFAQAAPAVTPNPFAQASTPGALANPNPFGQATSIAPAATTNPFAQLSISAPSSATANPFVPVASAPVKPNPFGQASTIASPRDNPFGKPQLVATSTTLNPFNTAVPAEQSGTTTVNGSNENNPYPPGSSYQHPPLRSYASVDARGMLTMFKGKPVIWRKDEDGAPEAGFQNRDGAFQKICFPAGAPPYNKDTEFEDDAYTEDITAAYKYFRETRSFLDGVMPLMPPKREFCLWDF